MDLLTYKLLILVGMLSCLSPMATTLSIPYRADAMLHLLEDEVPRIRPWAIYHGHPMHS